MSAPVRVSCFLLRRQPRAHVTLMPARTPRFLMRTDKRRRKVFPDPRLPRGRLGPRRLAFPHAAPAAAADRMAVGVRHRSQTLVRSKAMARSRTLVRSANLARSCSLMRSGDMARSGVLVLSPFLARSACMVCSWTMARSRTLVRSSIMAHRARNAVQPGISSVNGGTTSCACPPASVNAYGFGGNSP